MIEAINIAAQTVAANGTVIFGNTSVRRGCSTRHKEGSGRFTVLKPGVYKVSFQGNVAIPTGGTVAPISLEITQEGDSIGGSRMITTPAAVNVLNSVSSTALVEVYCQGGSETITVRNTTAGAITIQDANIVIDRLC